MMNSEMTMANLNILCERGFAVVPSNERIYVRDGKRVVFSEIDNSIKVESYRMLKRSWSVWKVKNFLEALELLDILGVK